MTEPERPVFEEPWQAKAFAIAVALHERGVYTWSEWAEKLGARVATAEASGADAYYCSWLDALEDMLVTKGVTTAGEAARWREAWRQAAARTPHGAPIEVQSEDFKKPAARRAFRGIPSAAEG
jgi:nitrile hydratase accessory protein